VQKKNGWKLQGKSFLKIFSEVYDESLYSPTYGILSKGIHASWLDTLDYCLSENNDGTFSAYALNFPPNIKYIVPLIGYCNPPFKNLARTY
jgi:hypothetical protein